MHVLCQPFNASAVRFESPAVSPNAIAIKDAEIGAIIKDHLAVNTTVVVTFDAAGKAIVRGSKTEGTNRRCLCLDCLSVPLPCAELTPFKQYLAQAHVPCWLKLWATAA